LYADTGSTASEVYPLTEECLDIVRRKLDAQNPTNDDDNDDNDDNDEKPW